MVDSIQKNNTVPVPPYQTGQGVQDPLPKTSPKEIGRVDQEVRTQDEQSDRDGFEDYLNQSGISTLEKQQPKPAFDPVSDVISSSTYSQPNDKTQF